MEVTPPAKQQPPVPTAATEPTAAKPPAMVRDYWPRYKKRAIILTVTMQIISTIAIGCALIAGGVTAPTITFWITLIAVLATSIGVNILLLTQLLEPLKNIASALTHVSGEPNAAVPPNPNAKHFESDGFKPLLQLIYQLAADGGKSTVATDSAQNVDVAAALDNSSTGLIFLDTKHTIIYANHAAPIHADPTGQKVIDLIFEGGDTLEAWLKECEERAVHAEHAWRRVPDKLVGEEGRRIFDVNASYEKGSQAEVIITLFERTGEYQPEDDSLDFIAFAAHELRGPITVIRGYLDVLGDELQPVLQPDQTELLNRLVVSANRLSGYINNILNASRYDRRHLKVHLEEDTIASIYDTIKDDMELRAKSQNRLLSVSLPTDLPAIAADRASISEVLGNLIDNAIKYSNEGGVVNVSAKLDGDMVKVAVADNGIGMPGNVVSNLFHKFYRSHRSRETVAGTGIGLYISKAIVESHAGTIAVRSEEGKGSIFEFSLPTYASVADKLKASQGSNESLIDRGGSWIKNHAMFRG